MKKLTLPLLVSFVVAGAFMTGCTKQSADLELQSSARPANNSNETTDRALLPAGGSISLRVLPPESKPVVMLYKEGRYYGEYTVATDGAVRIDNLQPGVYTIIIQPNNPDYAGIEFKYVKVKDGVTTQLGEIVL